MRRSSDSEAAITSRSMRLKEVIARWYDGMRAAARGELPGRYRTRAESSESWTALFGQSNLDRVSAVLRDICDALALGEHTGFQLRPTDRVIDIYNERYRHSFSADMLELETLIELMQKVHGIDLSDEAWQTVAFGDLVAMVLNGPRTAAEHE